MRPSQQNRAPTGLFACIPSRGSKIPACPLPAPEMVLQVVPAALGSVGIFMFGSIDFYYATLITVFELVGVSFGVRFAHSTNAAVLRNTAGILQVPRHAQIGEESRATRNGAPLNRQLQMQDAFSVQVTNLLLVLIRDLKMAQPIGGNAI
jgi:hypothetical protein